MESSRANRFAGEPATGCGALPLSYTAPAGAKFTIEPRVQAQRVAGLEPATSRLTVEVTHVYATGKNS